MITDNYSATYNRLQLVMITDYDFANPAERRRYKLSYSTVITSFIKKMVLQGQLEKKMTGNRRAFSYLELPSQGYKII